MPTKSGCLPSLQTGKTVISSKHSLSNARIAIVGLGYVGLPLAVEFGKKRAVIGFDINFSRIESLRAGHDSTLEVSGEEIIRVANRLRFTYELSDLADCNVYIVTVPTPIDAHKRPDLRPLVKASHAVGKVLKAGDIVIYESTVYPGSTEEVCVPILEQVSELTFEPLAELLSEGNFPRRGAARGFVRSGRSAIRRPG
jgi:UDP-N-acetyl-D-glucosamine/UDP-N-acetyl-D-galactosamine dehydrogenase